MIINASPLIIFGKLNRISILKALYNDIQISNEVYKEVVLKGIEKKSTEAFVIKDFIDNKKIKVINLDEKFSALADKIQSIYNLDIGEAETIALALQLKNKEVIIDEISARESAKAFGVKPIGSLRVLLTAYKKGLINEEEIHNTIQEMEDSKYRFSPKVLMEFWKLFGKIK